jgi:hypothetical protein
MVTQRFADAVGPTAIGNSAALIDWAHDVAPIVDDRRQGFGE